MTGIFATNAAKYFEVGYNVLPIEPYSKAVKISGWQSYCDVKQAPDLIENWCSYYANHNIGIPLGSASGIIGLDFDYDPGNLHEKVEKLLQGSLVKKCGQKGYTAFYRYNGESTKRWRKDGQTCVELLSTGTQTVVPPSIHPDTKKPYYWLTIDTLLDFKPEELTYLPKNFIEKVDEIFGYNKKKKEFSGSVNFEKAELSEVENALSFIPADTYDVWFRTGMALKEAFGDDGFAAWDSWSRKSSKYDDKGIYAKWCSFGNYGGNKVTVATIFHDAMGYGYIPLSRNVFADEDYDPDFTIPSGFKIVVNGREIAINAPVEEKTEENEDSAKIAPTQEKGKNKAIFNPSGMEFPKQLLDHAPGLPGEIAAWINSTALKRQPILALGAAICTAGTLFAHRICSDSDLRTNFQILGLAESGSGKEHARSCVESLFATVERNNLLLGEFASDVSILTSLGRNDGVGFALMDEIGLEMQSLSRGNAGNHEARILSIMMKIYSKAGGTYRGREYADREKIREDLLQPCLNIYGTSVAKSFFDAMTNDRAIDGFLARWLIFQSVDIDPPMQKRGSIQQMPSVLRDNLSYVINMPQYADNASTIIMGSKALRMPSPQVIEFSTGAERVLHEFSEMCNGYRVGDIMSGNNTAPIWSRTREHAIKLALVSYNYKIGIIDDDVMKWACELALFLTNLAIESIRDNISDNDHEKTLKRVYQIIKRYNAANNNTPMRHRNLTQATKFISTRARTEIITQLDETGMIEVEQSINANKTTSYLYMAVG